jgi:hypothetical protein
MKYLMFLSIFTVSLMSCRVQNSLPSTPTGNPTYGEASVSNQIFPYDFCGGASVPICNNMGTSAERITSQYTLMTIGPITKKEINGCSHGAFVDNVWRSDCIHTINMVVRGMPRSIPISQEQWEDLENGRAIQVTVVW